MAQSLEDIKAELEAPTHRIVNGERVDLTAEEIEATLDMWAQNDRTKHIDEEANGWIRNRQTEYSSLQDCIHALLDGGDTLTDLQAARQAVKDN